MVAIGLFPRHFMARSMEDAFAGLESIGFLCIIRPSFTWRRWRRHRLQP